MVPGGGVALAMMALELCLTSCVNPDAADDAADTVEHLLDATRIRVIAMGLSEAELERDMRRRIRMLAEALRSIPLSHRVPS